MNDVVFRSDMGVELIQAWGSDEMVARAARVSTRNDQIENAKIEGLIRYLVSENHGSTLEHSGMTFRFEAPLFVLGQFVRHRHLSPNVQSGRYSEYLPAFYVPENRYVENRGTSARPDYSRDESIRPGLEAERAARRTAQFAWHEYQSQLAEGVGREVARNVLPQSTYTSWYASGNLRAWLHFLGLRNGSEGHPQYEIVMLAAEVERTLEEKFPLVYKAWKETR